MQKRKFRSVRHRDGESEREICVYINMDRSKTPMQKTSPSGHSKIYENKLLQKHS